MSDAPCTETTAIPPFSKDGWLPHTFASQSTAPARSRTGMWRWLNLILAPPRRSYGRLASSGENSLLDSGLRGLAAWGKLNSGLGDQALPFVADRLDQGLDDGGVHVGHDDLAHLVIDSLEDPELQHAFALAAVVIARCQIVHRRRLVSVNQEQLQQGHQALAP